MQDIRGSLRRQSLLVALVCVVCDAALFSLRGPLGEAGWRAWVVLLAGIGVNAALAGAARYSGWVALAHALLFAGAPLLLCTCQGYVTGNNAGLLIAGFRAGAWLRPKPAVLALGALLAGVTVGCVEGGGRTAADWRLIAINVSVQALLPWLVGRYTTARRAYIADLEREAAERRLHEEEVVRRAVTEERTTIARDLHDVISHHVSAIGVHAGAARLGLPDGDSPVRKSLGAVESASRSAMADLRRLLDLLHAETTAAQPGLDNLDELVETVRAAGLPIRLTLRGEPRELPGSLDVALYRIVQEALTNALRHGEGPVEVELNHGRTEVVLTVTNGLRPDRSPPSEYAHRGLAGIRRRVTLFGGQVSYGEAGEDWQLRTTFPVEST
ncbi:two-component sensor histidine kinase [Amycolatopsis balhimycina DSM 5908]|uniref:histidine kinase n=1 Tax=Amycolatopsis balhimycina DSM 5908 TaxID=1081091 RepID=A0A428WK25_AMYBA|nr:histidine kinase [Amycolatopsis balhimycina]RSM43428.1 two-component sensor histidine kinase [Amycolatopsis balhimycina DSM 5908]